MCCNKPLTVLQSVERGLGPICAAKKALEMALSESGDHVDLPFDPATKDIVIERREDGLHFNIYQTIHHHSPTGFEVGYGGSGPADFALNILEMFMRERGDRPTLPLRNFKIADGERQTPTDIKICEASWHMHQDFKWAFVANVGHNGGTIKGDMIRHWIEANYNNGRLKLAA